MTSGLNPEGVRLKDAVAFYRALLLEDS